jgi:hypothetical protein
MRISNLYGRAHILTDTAGVGMGRTPARYLAPGDTVRTRIDGLGEMTHTFAAAQPPAADQINAFTPPTAPRFPSSAQ